MIYAGETTFELNEIGYSTAHARVGVVFRATGSPEVVMLLLPDLSEAQVNQLLDYKTSRGQLVGKLVSFSAGPDKHVATTIEGLRSIQPQDANSVLIVGLTSRAVVSPQAPLITNEGAWSFRLTNVSFRYGDFTKQSISKTTKTFLHDTIRFQVEGRLWELIDHRQKLGKAAKDELDESYQAVVTATLQTPYQDGDTFEAVATVASNIASLLSIVMSRRVCWTEGARVDAQGGIVESQSLSTWTAGANQGGIAVIDQRKCGEIKGFIETAYVKYRENPDWWAETIGIYLHSQIVSVLTAKAIFLNVLLERIATKVIGTKFPFQIAKDLDKTVEEEQFVQTLHQALTPLGKEWTEERTGKVIGVIKGWNAGPDLSVKVQMACEELRLEQPAKTLIKPRNPILHLGYMKTQYDSAAEYWTELDALVLLMLLRMLNYEGVMYHHRFGPDPICLHDLMVPFSESEGLSICEILRKDTGVKP